MHRWFIGALPLSLWVSWAAWRGPPPPNQYSIPAPISRDASPLERATVMQTARVLTEVIQEAAAVRGHPIQTVQLEAMDVQGRPYVDQIIPDNPLMPNIASIAEHCPPYYQASTADWVYCPQTGIILPVVNGQSLNGNE